MIFFASLFRIIVFRITIIRSITFTTRDALRSISKPSAILISRGGALVTISRIGPLLETVLVAVDSGWICAWLWTPILIAFRVANPLWKNRIIIGIRARRLWHLETVVPITPAGLGGYMTNQEHEGN